MAQTNGRSLNDLDEEVIIFLNKFLIDQCIQIQPDITAKKLVEERKLLALECANEQWYYFFDKKVPLLYLDLNLLIDGV